MLLLAIWDFCLVFICFLAFASLALRFYYFYSGFINFGTNFSWYPNTSGHIFFFSLYKFCHKMVPLNKKFTKNTDFYNFLICSKTYISVLLNICTSLFNSLDIWNANFVCQAQPGQSHNMSLRILPPFLHIDRGTYQILIKLSKTNLFLKWNCLHVVHEFPMFFPR